MKELKRYFETLNKSGTIRVADLPYGRKKAGWTVTFVLPIIDTTEGFYKMIVPGMALNKHNFAIRCIFVSMELYDPSKSINFYSPELKKNLIKETDFIVFPFVSYSLEPIIGQMKNYNKNIKIGYHVDFNYYAMPDSFPFSNLYKNQNAHNIIEENMRMVDRVFVSNKNLVDEIYEKTDEKYKKGYVNNIMYQPLLFNKEYFEQLLQENDKRDKPLKYRIGLIANPTHLQDINYIKGILYETMKKHKKDVEIVIVGFDGKHKKRNYLKNIDFRYIPKFSIFNYYQKINDLSFNLFLMPAKDNTFNLTSKNYVKFIELAYLNVPIIMSSVIQDTMPDNFRVQHNGTALICMKKEDWLHEIEQGIKKTEKVEQLPYPAFEHILNYDIRIPNNLKLIEKLFTF